MATAVSTTRRAAERAYLDDVAIRSVDLLLARLTEDARCLLWVVTLASEPVHEEMLAGVWNETPDGAPATAIAPLLDALHAAGLVTIEESEGEFAPGQAYGFHELVRERVAAWMDAYPDERAGRTAEKTWAVYGRAYEARFDALLKSSCEGARDAAAEAGYRGVAYAVRCHAFEALRGFSSVLVTDTSNPVLLHRVIAELQTAVELVDHALATVGDRDDSGEGARETSRIRWTMRMLLADALARAGRPDGALVLYKQAATEAEAARDWSDLAVIIGNQSNALSALGHFDAARAGHLRSAAIGQQAGHPRPYVLASEFAALCIANKQAISIDARREVLLAVEARLDEAREWWTRHRAAEPEHDSEAASLHEVEGWVRLLINGLDLAVHVNLALAEWETCLSLQDEIEQIQRARGESIHQLTKTRFNRCSLLLRLGRLDEAERVLESSLRAFRDANDPTGISKALSVLGELWNRSGDYNRAIAFQREALSLTNTMPDADFRALYAQRQAEPSGAGHEATSPFALPRLADLLTRPEFDALARFLADRAVNLDDLQAALDEIEAQARQAAPE